MLLAWLLMVWKLKISISFYDIIDLETLTKLIFYCFLHVSSNTKHLNKYRCQNQTIDCILRLSNSQNINCPVTKKVTLNEKLWNNFWLAVRQYPFFWNIKTLKSARHLCYTFQGVKKIFHLFSLWYSVNNLEKRKWETMLTHFNFTLTFYTWVCFYILFAPPYFKNKLWNNDILPNYK